MVTATPSKTSKPRKVKTVAQAYVIRAKLAPNLYRDVQIDASKSLYDLAGAILKAYDFDNDHAFGFYNTHKNPYQATQRYELFVDLAGGDVEEFDDDRPPAKSVKKNVISQLYEQDTKADWGFLFDYGDDWFFELKLKKVLANLPASEAKGQVVNQKGEAPEQYPDYDEEDEEA
jgi:hypothetical protein